MKFPDHIRAEVLILPSIAVALLILQWFYITTLGAVAANQLARVLIDVGIQAGVDEIGTSASKPAIESRLLGVIARRIHGIILIPIAGIAWLYLARIKNTRKPSQVLLGLATAAVLGAFLPLSIAFPDQLNYTRTITIAEPILISLAAGSGWLLWRGLKTHSENVRRAGRTVLLLLTVVLIAAQVVSAPIATDHPASYRGYLNGDEASAKTWGHQYAGTNISADPFFAHERPLPEAHVDSRGRIKEEYRQRYQQMLEAYTDRSLSETCVDGVMYRELEIYRSPRAQVLQWDPQRTLDIEYTKYYDSGGVQFYMDPRCR